MLPDVADLKIIFFAQLKLRRERAGNFGALPLCRHNKDDEKLPKKREMNGTEDGL